MPYLSNISMDLKRAVLTTGQIVPVHSIYDANLQPTKDINKATLVVVGPYTEDGKENQYVNADLTGTMSLAVH